MDGGLGSLLALVRDMHSRLPVLRVPLLKLPWRSMARIASPGELMALRPTYSLPYWVYLSPSASS